MSHSVRWSSGFAFILMVVLLALSSILFAAGRDRGEEKLGFPTIVLAGLNDYSFKGADGAMKSWTKGGILEGSKEAAAQLALLKEIESLYGNFSSGHLIETHALTARTHLVYVTLNYDRGPAFARFVAFKEVAKVKEDWIISDLSVSTKPEVILPNDLLVDPR
ncbi:MAG: hypothetical protein MPW14_13015 [Candidatus Manganitrophus sp.]|nr:hypothetical protein [Candidatus Manganitrophus sp.]WDT70205.1 MAG: hypothetical protein MPW17_15775 [Candidatus Manganitrophus sp.]WDT78143.1 MAG: hypothetical protein MPW14_13015 [Candidatus Manganitrophus sp.]